MLHHCKSERTGVSIGIHIPYENTSSAFHSKHTHTHAHVSVTGRRITCKNAHLVSNMWFPLKKCHCPFRRHLFFEQMQFCQKPIFFSNNKCECNIGSSPLYKVWHILMHKPHKSSKKEIFEKTEYIFFFYKRCTMCPT